MVNGAHMAAGCPSYGQASQLGDLALDYVQTMVDHNGRTQTTAMAVNTSELLANRGYASSSNGEMDFFVSDGSGSAPAAYAFWASHGTAQLMANCGITQLGLAVWIKGNNWAASAILGTPAQ